MMLTKKTTPLKTKNRFVSPWNDIEEVRAGFSPLRRSGSTTSPCMKENGVKGRRAALPGPFEARSRP